MGLPDGQEANSREAFNPHRLKESSEDSMLLSCSSSSPGSSLELQSIATGSSNSNRSSQQNDSTSSWHRNVNRPSAGQSQCNLCRTYHKPKEIKMHELRNYAVNFPDNIRWNAGAKKVTITRTAGKIGFRYTDVRGEVNTNTWYTMVIIVFAEGPSAGRISTGDCILSANGQPIQVSQGINLKSILDANESDPVTLMIQSPENRISNRRHTPLCEQCTPQSKNRGKDGRGGKRESQATRTDNLLERVSKSLKGHSNLNTLMPRLPKMRVLISGSEAENIAASILQGATQLQPSTTEVGISYRAFVSKKNSQFSMYTTSVEQKDEVELEVIALKDTPFSKYCHHVLATAHSIFIVQFSCRAFINNRQSVLMSIQQRLNKIRTYASNRVPIYLVMTSEDVALPAEQLANISKSLNLQFYEGFKNQLQYNTATDYPLFTAVTHHPGGGGDVKHLPSPFGNLGRQISREDNGDTGQSHVLYSRDSDSLDVCYYAKSTEHINSQEYRYEVRELREHLSKSAFQQDFIAKTYPYSFMLHRERVKPNGHDGVNRLHYRPKAWIMTVCDDYLNNLDPEHLLRFLHDNGDIVCSDYLEYSSSNSDMILLDREYLITLTKCLTTIPTRSQQQDPCLNDSIRHWDDLQEKSTASSMFLKYLLRINLESPNILTTLSQMNLIHCLDLSPLNSQLETSHIVPFFLPDNKTSCTQAYNHDPKLYNLCVDLHGSIPDGFFLTRLVELIREAEKTKGTWSIYSATSAYLSLGIDCQFDIDCDEVQSVINISARCSATYQHRELLYLLDKIFNPSQPIQSDLRITIGPPCPLCKEQCKTRRQVPWKTHVIDVAGGWMERPLRCGHVRVDEYPTVNRWLYRVADRPPMALRYADKVPVSKKTLISNLPPAMFYWICDKLNSHPKERNWQGLAGVLGYTYSEVIIFEDRGRNDYNPCHSFLLDWGSSANSTLGSLMDHLTCRPMRRMDILTMLREKWVIVD